MSDPFDNITPEQQAEIAELHFFTGADGAAWANGARPVRPDPGDEALPQTGFHDGAPARVTYAMIVKRDGAVLTGFSIAGSLETLDIDAERNAAVMAALVQF